MPDTGEIPTRRDQSNDLVRIVAVIYALVLGQCLIKQPIIFLHPLRPANRSAALAILVVFVAAAWEFLAYSLNMGRFPYQVRWVKNTDTATEEIRFALDLLIAVAYGALLIEALGLWTKPGASLF